MQQAPLVFRSVLFLRDFNEAKGSWAVASCATTGGGASLLYFDAAVWLSSASSPLLIWPSLPPLRLVFVFFVLAMWVCLCCPSRRVLWSPCRSSWFFIGATHIPPKSNPIGGWGSSISCFSFVGFFIFVPSFFVCGCMHGPPVLARLHLTNRRGHTHGGGHGPISSSFSWLSSCPAPKSAHQKVQKSSFMTPFYMQRHDKTTCIYDSLFSPIQWFQSCRCLVLSLHIFCV